MKNRYSAFTLSEVLITLGMIGVISAITLPVVINKINDMHYRQSYKKAYADLSQIYQRAITEHEYEDTPDGVWNSLKNYLKIVDVCESRNLYECWADADRVCTGYCGGNRPDNNGSKAVTDIQGRSWCLYFMSNKIILVDINGKQNPNRFGKDRFMFSVSKINDLTIRVRPNINQDILIKDTWCNHPPCYYKSWLYK